VLIAAPRLVLSQEQGRRVPQFQDFPAGPIYAGPKAPLHLQPGTDAWLYRTTLRRGYESTAINFAANYVVITWGCGSPCQTSAIVDARSGHVVQFGIVTAVGAKHRPESQLFIEDDPQDAIQFLASSPTQMDIWYPAAWSRYYRWDGHRLFLIDSVHVDTAGMREQ